MRLLQGKFQFTRLGPEHTDSVMAVPHCVLTGLPLPSMESLVAVSQFLAEILQARGELFPTNVTAASVLRGPAECAELTSGVDLLLMTSPNACSQADHFIEAAWRVLERDLCGWEGVEDWVSGRMLSLNLGRKCVRGSIVVKGGSRSLGRPAATSSRQRGALKQVRPVRSHPQGPDVAFGPHLPPLWDLVHLGRQTPPGGPVGKSRAAGAPVEGPSADCPVAEDKPILEEGLAVKCQEHGIIKPWEVWQSSPHPRNVSSRERGLSLPAGGLCLRTRNLLVLL